MCSAVPIRCVGTIYGTISCLKFGFASGKDKSANQKNTVYCSLGSARVFLGSERCYNYISNDLLPAVQCHKIKGRFCFVSYIMKRYDEANRTFS